MSLIDFILNLAALLLWLNWRSLRFDPLVRTSASSLAGTLRPAESRPVKGWPLLLGLGLLLLVRALLYWEIGSPADWTPKLALGWVVLPFPLRSELFLPVLLFSIFSFLRVWIVFHFWLQVLALLNHKMAEADPLLRLIRLHLGPIVRWPWPLQLALPLVVVAGLWMALHPLLVRMDVITRTHSTSHLLAQGLLVATSLVFSLKYLLPAILFLHLVSSYVYLGNSPFWDFVANTSRRLLAPLERLPLRLARVDFAPVVGIILVLLLLQFFPDLLETQLTLRNLTLWPQ